jgi:hypothetical protein
MVDAPGPVDPDSQALLLAIFRPSTQARVQNISRLAERVWEWDSFFQIGAVTLRLADCVPGARSLWRGYAVRR